MPAPVSVDQARRSLANRFRHLLGFRQTFSISGVKYRELSADSLRHALSRSGRGYKDFEATFADGASMRLRCTRDRWYADIAGARFGAILAIADPLLRPGMRVLLPRGGTGFLGSWIAGRVAPSGAVVSLESDPESVEYAQHRYRLPNASFESGGLEALDGETDAAFAGALFVDFDPPSEDPKGACERLWRLIRPGGWLAYVAARPAPDLQPVLSGLSGATVQTLSDSRETWSSIAAIKPEDDGDV